MPIDRANLIAALVGALVAICVMFVIAQWTEHPPVAQYLVASCVFDGSPLHQGDVVVPSIVIAGACHDTGKSTGDGIGRLLIDSTGNDGIVSLSK